MESRRIRRGRWSVVLRSIAVIASCAPPALAGDSPAVEQARDAFDQATVAYRARDFARAADLFARADELVPSDEALQAALESATQADDALLAMRLTDRAARAVATSRGLSEAKRLAEQRFSKRAGRLLVRCRSACSPSLDGRAISVGVPVWALVGSHVVTTSGDSAASRTSVQVVPSQLNEVTLRAPGEGQERPGGEALDPKRARTAGPSPNWFWVTAGATVALGGAALASGLDTLAKRDDFVAAGCAERGSDACDELGSSGNAARLRTNLFVAGAGVTGLIGAALAVFVVDWGKGSKPVVAFGLGRDRVSVAGSW